MDACKYIVVDSFEAGPAMLIFPPFLTHFEMAKTYFGEGWFSDHKACRERLLSAGFITTTVSGMVPYGKSDSLDKKCDPDLDAKLLRRMFPF